MKVSLKNFVTVLKKIYMVLLNEKMLQILNHLYELSLAQIKRFERMRDTISSIHLGTKKKSQCIKLQFTHYQYLLHSAITPLG